MNPGPLCKCCSSEEKGFPTDVSQLWQSGAKECHKATLYNKPYTRYLLWELGKTQDSLVKKQQETELKARFT